jgi:hypothetical protein
MNSKQQTDHTVKPIRTISRIESRTYGSSWDPFMHLRTSYARPCFNTLLGQIIGSLQGLGENKMSHLLSKTLNESAGREPRPLCRSAVEEGLGRRSPPDLTAISATNLAALKDAAAISYASLCGEAVHGMSSPSWPVSPLLRPASIDTALMCFEST